eukprot:216743-Prymnesium_polylepis.1
MVVASTSPSTYARPPWQCAQRMSHLGASGQGCGAWNVSHRAQAMPATHRAWASAITREWSRTSGHGRGR